MSNNASGEGKGLLGSLTRLTSTLVAIIHTRLELFSTDLEDVRSQLISLLVLALAALFFIGVGVVLVTILLVVAFWDTHRLLVLGSLAGFYLVSGLTVGALAAHKARFRSKPFAASLAELKKDRQTLTRR